MTTAKNYVSHHDKSTLERPRYSAGLLLEADDLTAAVEYTRNMVRLMFRSLFGCGVICGLDVTAQLTCNGTEVQVTVGKGVALDCLGNPIEVPRAVTVTFDGNCEPPPPWLWVTVCYLEKSCRPKDISCAPDEHGQIVQTRILDGFEVRVYPKRPKCACSCEPPDKGTPTRKGDCCDDEEEEETSPEAVRAQQAAAIRADTLRRQEIGASLTLGGPQTGSVAERYINMGGEFRPLAERLDLAETTGTDSTPAQPAPRPPRELCDCYQDHYDGKCDCCCCCPCVMVAKIDTTKTDKNAAIDLKAAKSIGLLIDRQWVRWIRPMLVGYYKCMKAVTGTTSEFAARLERQQAESQEPSR